MLARLRIAGRVTASVARLTTGWAGTPFAGRGSHPLDDVPNAHEVIVSHSFRTSLAWSHWKPYPPFSRLDKLLDTRPWCEALLAERGTLVVPGGFFEAPQHVRLGFGCDEQVLRAGLLQLSAALDAV